MTTPSMDSKCSVCGEEYKKHSYSPFSFSGFTHHCPNPRYTKDNDEPFYLTTTFKPMPSKEEIFSRPECPFHYCDCDPKNNECKRNNRCHHRPIKTPRQIIEEVYNMKAHLDSGANIPAAAYPLIEKMIEAYHAQFPPQRTYTEPEVIVEISSIQKIGAILRDIQALAMADPEIKGKARKLASDGIAEVHNILKVYDPDHQSTQRTYTEEEVKQLKMYERAALNSWQEDLKYYDKRVKILQSKLAEANTLITEMLDAVSDADDILAHYEDFQHGEYGKKITEVRYKIQSAIAKAEQFKKQ